MKRPGIIGVGCAMIAGVAMSFASPSAGAQTYPPPSTTPTPPADECVVVRGTVDDVLIQNVSDQRDFIEVEGRADCTVPGTTIEVIIESSPILLGTTTARGNGSFFGRFCLPSEVGAGDHTVSVGLPRRGVVERPLEVTTDDAGECSVDAVFVGGTSVLGTTETPGTSVLGATDGVLPNTGLDILLLILWALALIAVGSTGAFAAWRRVQTSGVSFARDGAVALPPPEIPRIDTSGFVPFRSSKAAEQTTKGKRPRRST